MDIDARIAALNDQIGQAQQDVNRAEEALLLARDRAVAASLNARPDAIRATIGNSADAYRPRMPRGLTARQQSDWRRSTQGQARQDYQRAYDLLATTRRQRADRLATLQRIQRERTDQLYLRITQLEEQLAQLEQELDGGSIGGGGDSRESTPEPPPPPPPPPPLRRFNPPPRAGPPLIGLSEQEVIDPTFEIYRINNRNYRMVQPLILLDTADTAVMVTAERVPHPEFLFRQEAVQRLLNDNAIHIILDCQFMSQPGVYNPYAIPHITGVDPVIMERFTPYLMTTIYEAVDADWREGPVSVVVKMIGQLFRRAEGGNLEPVTEPSAIPLFQFRRVNLADQVQVSNIMHMPFEWQRHEELPLATGENPTGVATFLIDAVDSTTVYIYMVVGFEIMVVRDIAPVGACAQRERKKILRHNMWLMSGKSSNNDCGLWVVLSQTNLSYNRHQASRMRATVLNNHQGPLTPAHVCALGDHFNIQIKVINPRREILASTALENPVHKITVLLDFDDADADVGHYYLVIREDYAPKRCQRCGTVYMENHGPCNPATASHYERIIRGNPVMPVRSRINTPPDLSKIVFYDFETFVARAGFHHAYLCAYKHGVEEPSRAFWGLHSAQNFLLYLMTTPHISLAVSFNGARFDHMLILRAAAEMGIPVKGLILRGSDIMAFELNHIKFRDLHLHIKGSLARACRMYGTQATKGSFPHLFVTERTLDYEGPPPGPEFYPHDDPPAVQPAVWNLRSVATEYALNDVDCLAQLYTVYARAIFDVWHDDVTRHISVHGLAYSALCQGLQEIIPIPKTPHAEFIRKAYYGGRVVPRVSRWFSSAATYEEAIRTKDYLVMWDVNSLYPTAMHHYPSPLGHHRPMTDAELAAPDYNFNRKVFIADCTFIPPKNLVHPLLPRRTPLNLLWNLEPGEGTYTSVDLAIAVQHGYQVTLQRGIIWDSVGYPWRGFVSRGIHAKQSARTPAEREVAKSILVGAYGKTGEQPHTSVSELVVNDRRLHGFLQRYTWNNFSVLSTNAVVMSGDKGPGICHRPWQIAAFIAAFSRYHMYRIFMRLDPSLSTLGTGCFYQDTDSCLTHASQQHLIADIIGPSLGQLSDDLAKVPTGEKKKIIVGFRCIAPKMYCLTTLDEDNNLVHDVTSKGIPASQFDDETTEAVFDRLEPRRMTWENLVRTGPRHAAPFQIRVGEISRTASVRWDGAVRRPFSDTMTVYVPKGHESLSVQA